MTLLKVPSLSMSSASEHQPVIPHPVTSDTPMTFVTNNTQLDETVEADPHTAQGTLGTDIFQQAVDFVPNTTAVPTQLIDNQISQPGPLAEPITQPASFDPSPTIGPSDQEVPPCPTQAVRISRLLRRTNRACPKNSSLSSTNSSAETRKNHTFKPPQRGTSPPCSK